MKLDSANHVAIVNGLRQSNEEVFRFVYVTYVAKLYSYAYRFVKDRELAAEIVQETMLTLWEKRSELDEQYPIGSILYTITKRLSLNALRKIANSRVAIEQFWLRIEWESNSTEDALAVSEMKSCLDEALEKLPSQQQAIFRLSRYEGYSHAEIASKLNISKNTVKNHLVIALKRLKAQFQHSGITYFLFLLLFS